METRYLDEVFFHWVRLSKVEKEFLLDVAKHYVDLKEETIPISIEKYNAEIDEAMKRMDEGEFYTHEEVVEMSKGWLHEK